jgi:hypothetical protein
VFDPFAAAQAAIRATFVDREQILYTQGGVDLPPIGAIRADEAAPAFAGAGNSLRTVSYEVQYSDLPAEPTKKDSFVHRARRWRVEDVTRLDDVASWRLIVVDIGAA